MRHAVRLAVAALLATAGLGGCAQSPLGMASSLAPFERPAVPVRGEATASEDPSSVVRSERAPAVEPAPVGLATHCGSSRGEQARAQCLRGGDSGAAGLP